MPTKFRRPIRQRIYLALHLMILVLSGLFTVGMLLLVFWFEHTLFYNHLYNDLERNIAVTADAPPPLVRQQGDITFYKLNLHDDAALPEGLRGYPEGDHEVLLDDAAFNLFVRHRAPWTYVLVQDQSEFERYEILLYSGVIIAVLLIWGVGYRLSNRIADQILLPITQLADAVTETTNLAIAPRRLTYDYPDDEVGVLAEAVDQYALQVFELLQREQQFTANASHELRTPMMVIQGACDLLRETLPTNPATARLLQRIEQAVQDMEAQMALFLRLARAPDDRESDDNRQPLHELVTAVVRQWQPKAASKGLGLRCEWQPPAPALQVPVTLTASVLSNLLRNAINHTDAGEILVHIDDAGITVTDSGEGIAPEVAHQILERGVSTYDLWPTALSNKRLGINCASPPWQDSCRLP